MKKILLGSSITLVLVLLAVFLVVPVLAQDTSQESENQWQTMYEACRTGDWQAMQEAMRQIDWNDMPCHQGYPVPQDNEGENTGSSYQWGGMMRGFGHMRGMMGW